MAGYTVEKDIVSKNTVVVYFPIETDVRGEKEVSIFEKMNIASEAQRHWADNSVSVTVSFDKKLEAEYIPTVLNMYEGKLKTVSFLPMGNDVYKQQPYTEISEEEYRKYIGKLGKIDMETAYLNGEEAVGEKYCATDVCEIKAENV
jgi:serine protease inhibitor